VTDKGTLTERQVQGHTDAAARSKAAFEHARHHAEKGPERRAAFAAQAVTYLADVDTLGIPRDNPLVAKLVHMGLNNIRAADADGIRAAEAVRVRRVPVGTVFAYRSSSDVYHTHVCEGIIKATEPDPLEGDPPGGVTVTMTLEQAVGGLGAATLSLLRATVTMKTGWTDTTIEHTALVSLPPLR
jgi:hypothetical protein